MLRGTKAAGVGSKSLKKMGPDPSGECHVPELKRVPASPSKGNAHFVPLCAQNDKVKIQAVHCRSEKMNNISWLICKEFCNLCNYGFWGTKSSVILKWGRGCYYRFILGILLFESDSVIKYLPASVGWGGDCGGKILLPLSQLLIFQGYSEVVSRCLPRLPDSWEW